jgi:mono/diheme cytochrome c family protein
MRRSSLVKSVGLVLFVGIAAGCPADDPAPAPPPPAAPPAAAPGAPAAPGAATELVSTGQQVYASAGCAACHGPQGLGTPLGPNLADGTWIWIEDTADLQTQLANVIRTGVSQPREYPAPMPPMGGASISEEQLQAVSAFIVSLNQ